MFTGSLTCFSPPCRQWYIPGLTSTLESPKMFYNIKYFIIEILNF